MTQATADLLATIVAGTRRIVEVREQREPRAALEARAAGADAVLLIASAVEVARLSELHGLAAALKLDVLVEVHDEAELDRALSIGARIIGVNNRNLRTLEVDVRASDTLIARMPGDVIAVSESGLRTADDVRRLRTLGYRAFLIGERFMTAEDPGRALRTFIEGARPC